jgi:hypothetical protein
MPVYSGGDRDFLFFYDKKSGAAKINLFTGRARTTLFWGV